MPLPPGLCTHNRLIIQTTADVQLLMGIAGIGNDRSLMQQLVLYVTQTRIHWAKRALPNAATEARREYCLVSLSLVL